jgi:Fe-S-cluster containining protein
VGEFNYLREKYKDTKFTHLTSGDRNVICIGKPGERCPFVVNNRCSIYADRPNVCRKFGEVAELECPKKKLPMAIFSK